MIVRQPPHKAVMVKRIRLASVIQGGNARRIHLPVHIGVHRRARAWTIPELLIVASLMAILAGLAFAPAGANDSAQVEAAGRLFAGMVEYAQSCAVARPDQTYIIKIDQANSKFWLANASTPSTPLTHPISKDPFQVVVGASSTIGLTSLSIKTYDFGGDDKVIFDSTGAVDQTSAPTIDFQVGAQAYRVALSPVSGAVAVNAIQTLSGGGTALVAIDQ